MSNNQFRASAEAASAAASAGDWKLAASLWRDAAGALRRALREIADTPLDGETVSGRPFEATNDGEASALHAAVTLARETLGEAGR